MNILSLGAGVQSSTLAMMAATGYLPDRLDAAIFADTQAEPKSVYVWLEWLKSEISRSKYPYPVYTVTKGNIAEDLLKLKIRKDGMGLYSSGGIPAYTLDKQGKKGIMRRFCTQDYKILPLIREERKLAKIKRGEKNKIVNVWIGISMDEIQRVKPSREVWAEHKWPLIKLEFTRKDCINWMKERGYPEPPRSACVFCPYHSDSEWARLKRDDPESFAAAVAFDYSFRETKEKCSTLLSVPYLHKSLQPLDKVEFNVNGEKELDQFNNECEGICGV